MPKKLCETKRRKNDHKAHVNMTHKTNTCKKKSAKWIFQEKVHLRITQSTMFEHADLEKSWLKCSLVPIVR